MSAKLLNLVLDLETLGVQEDAAIIQIGISIPAFDWPHIPEGVSRTFEATIQYEEANHYIRTGLFTRDNDTMLWWQDQLPSTRAIVFSGQQTYQDAFDQLKAWIESLGAPVAIWGNGADFDNRLLAYSLNIFGHKNLWNFRNNRCLRTLRSLFPLESSPAGQITVIPAETEIKHTALGDAKFESRVLQITRYAYKLETL